MDFPIRGEVQQLCSREMLAHDYLAALVQTCQVKTRLIYLSQCRSLYVQWDVSFVHLLHPSCPGVKAADHPISYRGREGPAVRFWDLGSLVIMLVLGTFPRISGPALGVPRLSIRLLKLSVTFKR
jgi:hypothetical protein